MFRALPVFPMAEIGERIDTDALRFLGFLGSHIVDNLLAYGFKVRGTARSASKLAALSSYWEKKYGQGTFETAVVENMEVEGAFEDALQGVSGVVHVAASISPLIDSSPKDPSRVIDPVVNGTRYILRSAAAEASVKSFVLTSSSFAAVFREKNQARELDEDSWNTVSVEKAYSLPLDDPNKLAHIYAAGKTLSERAAWKFYKEERPNFIVNTVIPNFNIGPTIGPQAPRSSGEVINQAVSGDMSRLKTSFHLLWFVDVRDTAALHVHALVSPELSSGGIRMWAVSAPFNGNDILRVLRELYPHRTFRPDFKDLERDLSSIDHRRACELLGGMRAMFVATAATRSALRPVIVASTHARMMSSSNTVHENDPETLEREKDRSLSDEKVRKPDIKSAPGWNENLASSSEDHVKADRHEHKGSVEDLQQETADNAQAHHKDGR
ncbi:hypothetical protein HWV62_2950 [Athelia sp. TMB]|nr:hypothetical protein HWV62_2950 [Athelia sp. TMB]